MPEPFSKLIPEPIRLEQSKLLLGEGIDEVKFFGAFLKNLGINNIQLLEYGGKNRLQLFLKLLLSSKDFDQITTIGITRDSDDSSRDHNPALSAFQSIYSTLENINKERERKIFPLPDKAEIFANSSSLIRKMRQRVTATLCKPILPKKHKANL